MTARTRTFDGWQLALLVVFFPLFAVYGLVVLVRGAGRFHRRMVGVRRGLAATLPCPNGHPNPMVNRFECAACHAVYHGWVGRCALCGAGAGWLPCAVCEAAIPLPWVAR